MIPVSPNACTCWAIVVASAQAWVWSWPRASWSEAPLAVTGLMTTLRP